MYVHKKIYFKKLTQAIVKAGKLKSVGQVGRLETQAEFLQYSVIVSEFQKTSIFALNDFN